MDPSIQRVVPGTQAPAGIRRVGRPRRDSSREERSFAEELGGGQDAEHDDPTEVRPGRRAETHAGDEEGVGEQIDVTG